MNVSGDPFEYITVVWLGAEAGDAATYHLELDANRFEVRRVEKYPDGRLLRIDRNCETDEHFLSEDAVPPNHELETEPEFELLKIAGEDFEKLWEKSIEAGQPIEGGRP